MTVRITTPQAIWLRKIRSGLNTSPPVPSAVIRALTDKKLIEEYRDRQGGVRYRISEDGWKFF